MAQREKRTTLNRSWTRKEPAAARKSGTPAKQKDAGNGSRGSQSREQSPARERGTALSHARDSWPFSLGLPDELSRLFSPFGIGRDIASAHRGWMPQVDVLRRGSDLIVRADLPGLKKEDVTIDVRDNVLSIRGERRDETREERDGYYWHERTAGSFVRSIPLPDGADTDNAKARFENGVLEVSVPAPEEQSSRGRRIEIR